MEIKIEKLSEVHLKSFLENAKGTYLAERQEILERYLSEQDNRLTIMAILPDIGPVGYAISHITLILRVFLK